MMKISTCSVLVQIWITLIICFISPSHETTYSCNASATCGCSMNSATVSRIVGGETAQPYTWTWAVSISISGTALCGGSIISNLWILTAAHCVHGFTESQFTIYAGSGLVWMGTQIRNVSTAIVHPLYNSTTFVNDIALLELESPLNMSDPYVSQICLPSVSQPLLTSNEWPSVGTKVVAVGWGKLNETGTFPYLLQQVTVTTVSYQAATCVDSMVDWHVQFCAGVPGGGKDTCQGDSGGPLMMFSSNNQWILVGVTSNGIGCAQADHSGMYTRVATYKSWIFYQTNGCVSFIDFNTTTSGNPMSLHQLCRNTISAFIFHMSLLVSIHLRFAYFHATEL